MANKRDLKKFIRTTCGSIAGECVLSMTMLDNIDDNKMGEALVDTADLQYGALKMASFSFDKTRGDFETPALYRKARRQYYKEAYRRLVKEFNEHVGEIVAKMNEAIPESTREKNKEAAKA